MQPLDRRSFIASSAGLAAVAFIPDLSLASPIAAQDGALGCAVIGAGRQGRAIMVEF